MSTPYGLKYPISAACKREEGGFAGGFVIDRGRAGFVKGFVGGVGGAGVFRKYIRSIAYMTYCI
jgi:hypothetical protein